MEHDAQGRPAAHVIGAGLAGLSAAVRLALAGLRPIVYEQAPRAGGRCRSFWDKTLSLKIDNGNHFVMSGNGAAMGYLDAIGARGELIGPHEAVFPFYDYETGARFAVRPGRALTPLWALSPGRGVPGAGALDFAEALNLLLAPRDRTVAQAIARRGALWRAFWEPLTIAALNAKPEAAQARLLAPVLTRTFLRGGAHCRPLLARTSLADAFVDPAARLIEGAGGQLRLGARVRGVRFEGARAVALETASGVAELGDKDVIVCAAPPAVAAGLIPDLATPEDGEAILNAHFRIEGLAPALPAGSPLIGVLGGATQWIAVRGEHVSLTISAASAFVEHGEDDLLALLWRETCAALALPNGATFAAARLIREKRATFAPTPENVARRPPAATPFGNLALAGDWTDTGLPATIEGAIASGARAARLALRYIAAPSTDRPF